MPVIDRSLSDCRYGKVELLQVRMSSISLHFTPFVLHLCCSHLLHSLPFTPGFPPVYSFVGPRLLTFTPCSTFTPRLLQANGLVLDDDALRDPSKASPEAVRITRILIEIAAFSMESSKRPFQKKFGSKHTVLDTLWLTLTHRPLKNHHFLLKNHYSCDCFGHSVAHLLLKTRPGIHFDASALCVY